MDICSPQQIDLPLKDGEKPVKIKGGFDKSAVITGSFGHTKSSWH